MVINQLVKLFCVLVLGFHDILLGKELLEAQYSPTILHRDIFSDVKNSLLHLVHHITGWVKLSFLLYVITSSHTSDVGGRDAGHYPQSQAVAPPETVVELDKPSQDTGSDAGEPTRKQVVHQVGMCGPGDIPGQLHTGSPAVEHLSCPLTEQRPSH